MDGSEEVASGFVVACGDGAELFKFGEEILDQVSSFVKFLVVEALLFAIGFRWNDGEFTGFLQRFEHPLVGIEAFIGDHRASFDARQQDVGSIQFTGLSLAEMKSRWVAERVHGGVDLGAQPALASADGLFFAPFFCARRHYAGGRARWWNRS